MSFLADLLNSIGPLATLALLIVGWYTISAVYSWYRLRHIPGPFLASFSYLWLARTGWNGTQLEDFEAAGRKYGSLFRIGPDIILTDDPELMKRMSSAKSKYWKSEWYSGSRFNPYHPSMFTIPSPSIHDELKAKVIPGYSGRDTPNVEADVDIQVNSFVNLIRRKYISMPGSGEYHPLDLARAISFFTLDVISRVALGKEFGCLETDSDCYQFYEAMGKAMPMVILSSDVPWIRNIIYSTIGLKLFGPKETDPTGLGKAMSLSKEAVRKLFESDIGKEQTMLGSFARYNLPRTQIEVEALFMFAAGSDTTAAAIRCTFLHLLSTPRVYYRLKDEVGLAVHDGRVSSPITNAEVKELPYLQAVIFEGLRMRPVVTSLMPKEVPHGGDTIDGKFIPEGTSIGVNFWPLLRSKARFGEDADLFRPERLTEADEETRLEMQRQVELAFGYGRWMCAGKPIAMMELNKIYFELFRHFDIQLVNPQKPLTTYSHGLFIDKGLLVTVAPDPIGRC
ncbi:cytochrome P450 [Hypoxylon trugodes]|uniref:cytochrome P450 n=1 Tax=Hypoxylon trugodes TaxID=326681 RepID=UPI00218D2564|nr:cytochrome P450 [Hypoxylon trugodes]KAI1387746.1 cytochrome P450 [Hypoxylon trugodes]